MTATRSSNRPSVKEEEDQEGEEEGDIQPRARAVDGQEGSKGRSPDVQEAKYPADTLTEASRRSIKASVEIEEDQVGEADGDIQPRARAVWMVKKEVKEDPQMFKMPSPQLIPYSRLFTPCLAAEREAR